MDKSAKKAIGKNRVRLLNLDYFDLTGPLLAGEIFPIKKHKDIKNEAQSNKARVDLLLEWIDESAPNEAFQPFLQGIRNCQENMLAKKIKKEATDGGMDIPPKPRMATNKPAAQSAPGAPPVAGGSAAGTPKANAKSPKPKPPKKGKDNKDVKPPVVSIGGLGTLTLPMNGLEGLLPPPISLPIPIPSGSGSGIGGTPTPTPGPGRKRSLQGGIIKQEKGAKTPKAAGQNGAMANKPNASAAETKAESASKSSKKGVTMKSLPTKAPRITRASIDKSTDNEKKGKKPKATKVKVEGGAANAAGSGPKGSASPKSPKLAAKAKVMTFKEVEIKQQDSRQKFKFKNDNAVVKIVHFKDKTDISYLGCPFEDSGKICEKKVELKNKEFVCESRHKSPNCKQIPRLYVTCNDGTADLQLTLLKKDVEIFCGKTAAELGTLTISDIKEALDTTVGKNYSVEVNCEKAKKIGKKMSIPKWSNLATVVGQLGGGGSSSNITDDGPAAKKKRKN